MEEVNSMIRARDSSRKGSVRKTHHQMKGPVFKELYKQIKKGDLTAVVSYNNYIRSLLSIHQDSRGILNWDDFREIPEPKLPLRPSLNQDIAEEEYKAYQPTMLDKILGQRKKKLSDLMKNTEQAKRDDDLIYNASLKEFKNDHQEWKKGQLIAVGVKNKEPVAYQQAIEFFEPFKQILQLGAKVDCESFTDYIIAHLNFHWAEVIPDYMVTQTAAGKVLSSQMPDLKFNEICHHHVCASALRTGREIFALLPIGCVLVHAYANLPDKKTGSAQKKIILSVKFTRTALQELNFSTLNGPDFFPGFPHHMDFSVEDGFLPTQPLSN